MRLALAIGLSAAGGLALLVISASGPVKGQVTTVVIADNWFCEASFENGVCETTVNAGSTVRWEYTSGDTVHTVTECGDSLEVCDPPSRLWHSGSITEGGTFSRLFDTPGLFLYRCQIHPVQMRGRLIVQEAPQSTPTSTATFPVTPSPTPSATPGPEETASPTPEQDASPAMGGGGNAPRAAATENPGALPVGGGLPPKTAEGSDWWFTIAGALAVLLAGTAVVLVRLRRG